MDKDKFNNRYVVFKPFISINSNDKERIEGIIDKLNLNVNITKIKKSRKRLNPRYDIVVQDFDLIDEFLEKVDGNLDKEKLKTFKSAKEKIEKVGKISKKWDDDFEEIIELKLKINNSSKGFTKKEWIKKIKVHLDDGGDL